jgi:two component transcriptional regulator, winged helix family
MSGPRILVVEDEPAIADTIVYALTTEGFEPVWCATGGAALDAVGRAPCALAILDVGLPDINGFDGYRARIRNHGHSCFLCEIVIRSQFHTTYEPEA